MDHKAYLWDLQMETWDRAIEEGYLWPRTPLFTLQTQIEEFVGATDCDPSNLRSRPYRIIEAIGKRLTEPFSLLDICCGDALILSHIGAAFPKTACYGIDIAMGLLCRHKHLGAVRVYRIFLQELARAIPPEPFDLVMMLNSYRSWPSAMLRPTEQWLPGAVDVWFARSARNIIVTAGVDKMQELEQAGWIVEDLGRCEQQSRLVWMRRPPA